jgi:DNA-binding PadR family transcriptional regulator
MSLVSEGEVKMSAKIPKVQTDILTLCRSSPKILQEVVTALRKDNGALSQGDVLSVLSVMVNNGYLKKVSETRRFPIEQCAGSYVVTLYQITELGRRASA